MSPPTSGKSLRPDPIASVPSTPWKYCGMVNKIPSMARIGNVARITPQVNDGRAEQRQIEQRLAAGPMGQPALPGEEADQQRHSGEDHEQGADVAPAVLACLDQAVGQDDQPGGGGRHPDGSKPGRSEARESGTKATTAAKPTTTTGTLIRNTQPHQ